MTWIGILLFIILIYFHWKSEFTSKSAFRKLYFPFLLTKLLLGSMVGIIYTYYYQGGDTFALFNDAKFLSELAINQPSEYINYIFSRPYHYPEHIQSQLLKSNASTSIFCILLSLINIFTNNNYWISGLFFSTFSFMGIWFYINTLKKYNPKLHFSLILPFIVLPSFAFWSSGIIKESICMGICFSIAGFWVKTEKEKRINWPLLFIHLLFAFLLLQIKFYYFLYLFLMLSVNQFMFRNNASNRKVNIKTYFAFTVLIILILLLLPKIHYHFDYQRLLTTLETNYIKLYSTSKDGTAIELPYFDGSLSGFIISFPFALIGAFELSNWNSSKTLFQWYSLIENLIVLIVFSFAVFQFTKIENIKKRPFLIGALVFSILCTLLFIGIMGIASPNLGSLSRYKILFLSTLTHISLIILEQRRKVD